MLRGGGRPATEPAPEFTDLQVTTLAAAVAVGAWWAVAVPLWVGAIAAGWALVRRRAAPLALAGMLLASGLAARAWAGIDPPVRAEVQGWVTLRSDPERFGAGVRAVVELDGRRYLLEGYGQVGRKVERLLMGERVEVAGRLAPFGPSRERRWAIRHVTGRFELVTVGDTDPGAPAMRAANRVRRALERSVADWPELERGMFLGLVIGDDRSQPRAVVDAFRAAGLSHLTAVSGQNVAFVLLAAGPLLRRLRPGARWGATLGLVAWFALLTRFEPSVLRASGMAMLAATAYWRGWQAGPGRLLALAVAGLVLVDPFLVHSVGFWLSVGATTGLAVLARPLAERLPGPPWFAGALAVTLAAQVGVLPVSAAVFGRVPVFAPVANLLAVPVAGFVMVWGLPAGLFAAALPGPVAELMGVPALAATRWVLAVARLADRLEPGWPPGPTVLLQAGVCGLLVALRRPRHRAG